eukprot:311822-Chlamydomonas_euryale.AAC.8
MSEKQVLSGTVEAAAQWQARLASGSVSLAELYDGADGDGDGWSDENDVTWEDADGDDEGSKGGDGDSSGDGGRGRRA